MTTQVKVLILTVALALGVGSVLGFSIYTDAYLGAISEVARLSIPKRKLDPEDYAWEMARKHKLNRVAFVTLLFGESRFNPEALGVNKNGTVDLGLCQINTIHKDISLKDRLDPYKCIDWSIKKRLRDGNWSAWVAARKFGITK